MSSTKSKLWGLALPLSLVFLAAVYYIKIASFRGWVDARTAVPKQYLGQFVKDPEVRTITVEGEGIPAGKSGQDAGVADSSSASPIAKPSTPAPRVIPQWPQIASDPSLWPKKVVIKQDVKFPAVVNGKQVGSLVAPAGTEVNVRIVQNEKVGVEYKGGGAWLTVEQTDLIARAQRQ
jgi:hypothetical protein